MLLIIHSQHAMDDDTSWHCPAKSQHAHAETCLNQLDGIEEEAYASPYDVHFLMDARCVTMQQTSQVACIMYQV